MAWFSKGFRSAEVDGLALEKRARAVERVAKTERYQTAFATQKEVSFGSKSARPIVELFDVDEPASIASRTTYTPAPARDMSFAGLTKMPLNVDATPLLDAGMNRMRQNVAVSGMMNASPQRQSMPTASMSKMGLLEASSTRTLPSINRQKALVGFPKVAKSTISTLKSTAFSASPLKVALGARTERLTATGPKQKINVSANRANVRGAILPQKATETQTHRSKLAHPLGSRRPDWKITDKIQCKERPEGLIPRRAGGGASKNFVPWCE